MSAEENKAIVRRWFEELFSRANLDAVDEIISPDYVLHDPGLPQGIRGTEGFKQFISALRTAFPDLHSTLEDIMDAEGSKVVTRDTWGGTNQGMFLGFPPTYRQVTAMGIDIFRIANGKIVEQWASPDLLGAAVQLGVISLPEHP
jgi:steroid delta-isomerase-like uncharacterized protein